MDNQRINEILSSFWDGIPYGTGTSCSVTTLLALAEYYNMVEPWMKDVATPFGGGVCHSHISVCGVVSGALLFLGLKLPVGDEKLGQETSARLGAELIEHVKQKFGCDICDKILDIDFNDEEQVKMEKADKYESICQPVMRDVCEWVISKVEELEK
jgi:C_GCAxxG_C_C family probable redox protein